MSSCVRISELGAIGLHTVRMLVEADGTLVSNRDIADFLRVSEHSLAKVHQRLVHAGIIQATRGPGGGFTMARPSSQVSLLEIVEAIEGSYRPSECLLGRPSCTKDNCVLGALSDSINRQVTEFLATTMAERLAGNESTTIPGL